MEKVLITGATGFIGRHCVTALLRSGCEVHAVSSKTPEMLQAGVHWHGIDLMNSRATFELINSIKASHLLHLAWYVAPGKCLYSLENIRWVQASLNLFQAFTENGGERTVIAGTSAEYDSNYGYCTEGITPLTPVTTYGICKHALQTVIASAAKQIGVSMAWGRIFDLYGPYEHPDRLVPSVIRSLLRKEPAKCSQGNQIRDYLYVKDVAEAFVALLETDVQGPVNIASGCPIILKDLIYRVAGKLDGGDLVQLGALPARANDPPVCIADTTLLSNEVGWRPHYDLDQSLDETISWWQRCEERMQTASIVE